jgi:hypothetical protein
MLRPVARRRCRLEREARVREAAGDARAAGALAVAA